MAKEPRYVRTTNDINDDTLIRIVKGDPPINKVISVRDLFNDVDVNNLINYTINGNYFTLSEDIKKDSIVQLTDNNEIEGIKNVDYTSNIDKEKVIGILPEDGLKGERKPVLLFGKYLNNTYNLEPNSPIYITSGGTLSNIFENGSILIGKTIGDSVIDTAPSVSSFTVEKTISELNKNTFTMSIIDENDNVYSADLFLSSIETIGGQEYYE